MAHSSSSPSIHITNTLYIHTINSGLVHTYIPGFVSGVPTISNSLAMEGSTSNAKTHGKSYDIDRIPNNMLKNRGD